MTWEVEYVFVKEKIVSLLLKLESTEFWLPSLSTFQQICTLLDRGNCLSEITKKIFTGDEANIIVYNLIMQTVILGLPTAYSHTLLSICRSTNCNMNTSVLEGIKESFYDLQFMKDIR